MNGNNHIENLFKEAFENFEVPVEASEMANAWQKVSQSIPAPASPTIPQNPMNIFQTIASKGAWVWATASFSIVTLAVVILSVFNNKEEANQQAQITPQTLEVNVPQAPSTIVEPNKVIDKNTEAVGNTTNTTPNISTNLTKERSAEKASESKPKNNLTQGNSLPSNKDANTSNIPQKSVIGNIADTKLTKEVKNNPTVLPNNHPEAVMYLEDTTICINSKYEINVATNLEYVNFGDGSPKKIVNKSKVEHQYNRAGTYTLETNLFKRQVKVVQNPKATFSKLGCNGLSLTLKVNPVMDAKSYWMVNGGMVYPNFIDGKTVNIQLVEDGAQQIIHILQSSEGCIDTAILNLQVNENQYIDVVPNIITPNGDGKNDRFVIDIAGEEYFDLQVTTLKGEKVFQSTDKHTTWDGSKFNSGNLLQNETYYYILKYKFPSETEKIQKGNIFIKR
jgi:gliding motility-associated-like protein